MKLLLIEDDPVYLQILEIYCQKLGTVFSSNHIRELPKLLHGVKPDIIIADVFMAKESSIEHFKKEDFQIAPILFISNSESLDAVVESLKIPFSLFLKKPLEPISLELHIQYLIREFALHNQFRNNSALNGFMIKGKFNQDLQVDYGDILYLESDRNYLSVILRSGKISTFKHSISKFLETSPPNFIRISKSVIINVFASTKWKANLHYFYLDKKIFPIGKSYQENVRNQLKSMYLPFLYEEI